jgi:hypothetical protein
MNLSEQPTKATKDKLPPLQNKLDRLTMVTSIKRSTRTATAGQRRKLLSKRSRLTANSTDFKKHVELTGSHAREVVKTLETLG